MTELVFACLKARYFNHPKRDIKSQEGGFQTRPYIAEFLRCVLCVPITLSNVEGCGQFSGCEFSTLCLCVLCAETSNSLRTPHRR